MDNICLAWGFLCITEISVLKAIMIFKWSKIAGMDDIFFGQILAKGNFGFLVLSQVKYFRLQNRHSPMLIIFWTLFQEMRFY